jgi:hypothetical protein
LADDRTPSDAGPGDPNPMDWESPRWREPDEDPQGSREYDRRYRNAPAKAHRGAIDTPDEGDREAGDAAVVADDNASDAKNPAGGPDRV